MEGEPKIQKITPWEVEIKRNGDEMPTINYDHIVEKFGCQKLTTELVEELKRLSPIPVHRLIRRGLVFAHRDLNTILDVLRKGKKFYLYTGRGPSTKSMHIGHSIPFGVCKYFQDAFQTPIVIQITDDEKYLCKEMDLEEIKKNAVENIKDIIAHGFNPSLTYIFINSESSHLFKENILKLSKIINVNEAFKVFGFSLSTPIGMVEFIAKEMAPAYCTSFEFLGRDLPCLIPSAVDQDPYFRIARDKAVQMGELKPSTIYMSLLPDLQGPNKKMSASDPKSSIYLDDSMEAVEKKIKCYSYSGGQETLKLHREKGGNTKVDVAYQYLRYFLEDDEELEKLKRGYEEGKVLSGEMKKRAIKVIQEYLKKHQEERRNVDKRTLNAYMSLENMKS